MASTSDSEPSATPAPAIPTSLPERDRCLVLNLALHHIGSHNIAHQLYILENGHRIPSKDHEQALVALYRDLLNNISLQEGTVSDVFGLLALLQGAEEVERCGFVLKPAVEHEYVHQAAKTPLEARKLLVERAKARRQADKKAVGAKNYNRAEAKKGEANAPAETQRLDNARITPQTMQMRLQELIKHHTINGSAIDKW